MKQTSIQVELTSQSKMVDFKYIIHLHKSTEYTGPQQVKNPIIIYIHFIFPGWNKNSIFLECYIHIKSIRFFI